MFSLRLRELRFMSSELLPPPSKACSTLMNIESASEFVAQKSIVLLDATDVGSVWDVALFSSGEVTGTRWGGQGEG